MSFFQSSFQSSFHSPLGLDFVWADPLVTRLLLASLEFAVLALVIAVVVKLWGAKRPRVAVYLWTIVLFAVTIFCVGVGTHSVSRAEEAESTDTAAAAAAAAAAAVEQEASELPAGQAILKLPVRVVDTDGVPVANAKVTPWALRSSQGHGRWHDDDEWAGVGPTHVVTDDEGLATVLYPRFRNVQERTHTTAVSLFVDHPKFAFVDRLHIDVPLEFDGPYEIKLMRGAPVEILPLIDGAPADLDDLFTVWSDGRSWQPDSELEELTGGVLRIPAMPPGTNSLLLVQLEGGRPTYFSDIVDFDLQAGEPQRMDVPLRPALRIEGVLSDNVPRPVRGGRVKIRTLPPAGGGHSRVHWFTWAPVRPDGTFTIDGWPAGEPLQVTALCEGYIATSGNAPDAVENPPPFGQDPFHRPQVFDPVQGERIDVAMTPLVRCVVTTVDEDEKPLAGITVSSWPNVGWWNGGSQIYCHPLVRGERLLRTRNYQSAIDESFPQPFQGETDADGKVTLELPAGSESLAVSSDHYELPVFLGRRHVGVELTRGEVTEIVLRLQPRGTDELGEWERLADDHPAVRQQVNEVIRRLRQAKNQPTPQMLSEAYLLIADAFLEAGDHAEAARWIQKAGEQALKVKNE